MKKGVLIAFGELFLKSSSVQKVLKRKLLKNLYFFLKKANLNFKIFLFRERIFIETEKTKSALKIVKNVFGISWFTESLFFQEKSLKEVSNFIEKNYENWIKKNETFAIRLKKGSEIRENRNTIIKEIAQKIKRKVDLGAPKKEIFLEARREGWYLYFNKKRGPGGLPVGSQGKVLSLISGGIDSPVASYLIAKRGAENIWLHFHSFPLVSNVSIEKIKKLAQIFLKFQPKLKVYLFPFSKIQIEIKTKAIPKYYILLYRRVMLRIAQKIARMENCQAIVTGESLGQVSSQTLDNIRIIEETIKFPILRPLIGMNKEEIIKIAKKIGTFEISILPQEDCCRLFVPKRASAKGNLKIIKELERTIELEKLIKIAQKEIKVLKF